MAILLDILDIFTSLVNQYFLLIVFLPLFSTIKAASEVNLKIKGQGEKNIINNTFYLTPSKVLVNGILKETGKKSCYLDKIGDVNILNPIINLIIKKKIVFI